MLLLELCLSFPFLITILSNLSDKKSYYLHGLYGERERCEDCDGDVILYGGELCYNCSSGHQTLKDMGIETKWNRKV